MKTLIKAATVVAFMAAALAVPATAQNYYRTLDHSYGCLIDVGRTNPPNGAYAYTYTIRNQCQDRAFRIYYNSNGADLSGVIGRGEEWGYPVLNGQSFQLTGLQDY